MWQIVCVAKGFCFIFKYTYMYPPKNLVYYALEISCRFFSPIFAPRQQMDLADSSV